MCLGHAVEMNREKSKCCLLVTPYRLKEILKRAERFLPPNYIRNENCWVRR